MRQSRLMPWHGSGALWTIGLGAVLGTCAIGGGSSLPPAPSVRPAEGVPARFERVAPVSTALVTSSRDWTATPEPGSASSAVDAPGR
jgi:hypothetical protein